MFRNRDANVKNTKIWKIKLLTFYLYNEEYEELKSFLKNIKCKV